MSEDRELVLGDQDQEQLDRELADLLEAAWGMEVHLVRARFSGIDAYVVDPAAQQVACLAEFKRRDELHDPVWLSVAKVDGVAWAAAGFAKATRGTMGCAGVMVVEFRAEGRVGWVGTHTARQCPVGRHGWGKARTGRVDQELMYEVPANLFEWVEVGDGAEDGGDWEGAG